MSILGYLYKGIEDIFLTNFAIFTNGNVYKYNSTTKSDYGNSATLKLFFLNLKYNF